MEFEPDRSRAAHGAESSSRIAGSVFELAFMLAAQVERARAEGATSSAAIRQVARRHQVTGNAIRAAIAMVERAETESRAREI